MNIRTKKTLDIDLGLYETDIVAIGLVSDLLCSIDTLIRRETHDKYSFQDFLCDEAYGADVLDIFDDLENNPTRFTNFLSRFIETSTDG